ncbi:MAG: hypothetical protein OHK0022_08150 [Roseiflexaceae bacterium]
MLTPKPGYQPSDVEQLVQDVLDAPEQPKYAYLQQLQARIDVVLENDTIDLVYGGATKIKEYVFEAPKLPEIRGASTLLDWVNEVELPALWGTNNGEPNNDHALAQHGIIYASGGNILGFAPAGQGAQRALEIERAYTDLTLTANSVAVSDTFRLIELRYGRDPLGYWVDNFREHWQNNELRDLLKDYYYSPLSEEQEPPEERFFRRKTFGELVTLLAIKYYQRRSERPFDQGPSFFPRQPWDERCDSSDLRPAVVEQRFDDGIRQLSAATARKLIVGRVIKDESRENLALRQLTEEIDWGKRPDVRAHSWDRRWRAFLADKGRGSRYAEALADAKQQISPAPDVHEIAGAGEREIAMIYADGNNVGRLMATLKTPQQYAQVSQMLSEATKEAVLGALAEVLRPAGGFHPFEILTIGGDDLMLLVPGRHGLEIALRIAQRFEQAMAEKLEQMFFVLQRPELLERKTRAQQPDRYRRTGEPLADVLADDSPLLGLSAGVVVARDNTPIFHLYNLSKELLDSAKKKARKQAEQKYYGGAIDFMVLRSVSIVADRIEDFRANALRGGANSLTARPYSWHELAGLLATVRALRAARVPPSQLYRLREILVPALDQGIAPSVLEYLFARTRMQPRYAEALLKYIEQAWQSPDHKQGAPGVPPWMRTNDGGLETVWADMLEIYDLAGEEQDHGPDRD